MIETIHFRTTLDIKPASEADVVFDDLVWEITGWIRAKEGPSASLKVPWVLRSGNWRKPDGKAEVTTDSVWGESNPAPDVWALRYEHQDRDFPARRWTTDIGLAALGGSAWRMSLTVGNSLHHNFMGQEPGRLPVTPPRFLKDLVTSDQWICTRGSTVLRRNAEVLAVGKANRLRDAIADPNRACAIVYVSCDRASGAPLIDASRLASCVVGSAYVFVAAGDEIDDELEYLLPFEFRAPNGMVRVYAPNADLDSPSKAYRHRFFTRAQIATIGAGEIEEQIARSLTRRLGWTGLRSSVGSIDDVVTRRREIRRIALEARTDVQSKDELLALYKDANQTLESERTELLKQKEAGEQLVEEAGLQLEALREQVKSVAYERDAFFAQATSARQEASALAVSVRTARSIEKLPSNLADVIELIERLHAGAIVFTDRAKDSARVAGLNDVPDGVEVAWKCLHGAATVLPRLAFDEQVSAGGLPEKFQHATHFELTMTEGAATKANSKLLEGRRIQYDGTAWDISPHIKYGGRKPPRCLRVHFALDADKKRVIVGHCGDHLETAGTRRRS